MTKSIKVFIFSFPLTGHSNPMLSMANELIRRHNCRVIVYSVESFREQIEKIGAEYRALLGVDYEDVKTKLNTSKKAAEIVPTWFELSHQMVDDNILKLAREIDFEKPDLVLYDRASMYGKWAIRLISELYNQPPNPLVSRANTLRPTSPAPPVIVYWTTFINEKNVYPDGLEDFIGTGITFIEKLRIFLSMVKIAVRAKQLSLKYGLKFVNLYEDVFEKDPQLINIVFTFPELHPRSHLFEKNTKFVGSCIDDRVHIDGLQTVSDNRIKATLQRISYCNPLEIHEIKRKYNENALIFVSLGTIYNDGMKVYSTIINAFNTFDKEPSVTYEKQNNKRYKLDELFIIMSVGPHNYDECLRQIKSGILKVPENMILIKYAPQLEVLRRASLFITHCGMNSTNEAIYFGVPMVCIPLSVDQPLVAQRIAIDLGLGVLLDVDRLKVKDLRNAVHKVLHDPSYHERCLRYSQLSRQYEGQINSANLCVEYVKSCEANKLRNGCVNNSDASSNEGFDADAED